MSKILYFELVNGGIITNYELSIFANVNNRRNISCDDLPAIRQYAATCKGVKREILEPTVEECIKFGNYIKAVEIYREKHETTLTNALDAVISIKKKLNDEVKE